ncbi:ribonuclease III [Flavobacteriaceae bacterium]|nr:ribonuclease III [Flavobacteriaceae bacterium]
MNIHYSFKNKSLLTEAVTHPSFCKKKHNKDYERLEFLGDSILSIVIADFLFKKYPLDKEGELSKKLSYLVSGRIIYKVAKKIDIGSDIFLSKGEEMSDGRKNRKILENATEALIAAIYLDSDIEECRKFILENWQEFIGDVSKVPSNPISDLQEITQEFNKTLPVYKVIKYEGSDHEPKFKCNVKFGKYCDEGYGDTKKMAKQEAAKNILKKIKL